MYNYVDVIDFSPSLALSLFLSLSLSASISSLRYNRLKPVVPT